MTRPDDNYRTCSPGCGCDLDLMTDPEEDAELYEPCDIPADLTPGERLLWAIFGKQPPDDLGSDDEPTKEPS